MERSNEGDTDTSTDGVCEIGRRVLGGLVVLIFVGVDTKMVNLEKEGEQRSKQGSELVFFLINSSGSLVRKKKISLDVT